MAPCLAIYWHPNCTSLWNVFVRESLSRDDARAPSRSCAQARVHLHVRAAQHGACPDESEHMSTLLATSLLAWCPDCPTARDARIMFFENNFLTNLAFALAPFVVTLAVVVSLLRSIRQRPSQGRDHAKN